MGGGCSCRSFGCPSEGRTIVARRQRDGALGNVSDLGERVRVGQRPREFQIGNGNGTRLLVAGHQQLPLHDGWNGSTPDEGGESYTTHATAICVARTMSDRFAHEHKLAEPRRPVAKGVSISDGTEVPQAVKGAPSEANARSSVASP